MFFKDFTVILPPEVENKIMYWVHKCDKEISGLGDAWLDVENKLVRITSAFLVDQECTATETELDDTSISKVMNEAHQDEIQGRPRSIKFWWHSHVNMGVFWSTTDNSCMNKLSEHGWFVNIVFNKKNEKRCAISYPIKMEVQTMKKKIVQIDDEIRVSGAVPLPKDYTDILDKEYEEKYKEKRYITPYQVPTSTTRDPYDYAGWEEYEYYNRGSKEAETEEEKAKAKIADTETLYNDDFVRIYFGEDQNIWAQVKSKGAYAARTVRWDTVPTAVPMFCYYKMDHWVLETLISDLPRGGYVSVREAILKAMDTKKGEAQ